MVDNPVFLQPYFISRQYLIIQIVKKGISTYPPTLSIFLPSLTTI